MHGEATKIYLPAIWLYKPNGWNRQGSLAHGCVKQTGWTDSIYFLRGKTGISKETHSLEMYIACLCICIRVHSDIHKTYSYMWRALWWRSRRRNGGMLPWASEVIWGYVVLGCISTNVFHVLQNLLKRWIHLGMWLQVIQSTCTFVS